MLPSPRRLPWLHGLLALAVVAVWGSNFAIIKLALAQLPPMLFATLRFALAFVPAALFIARPRGVGGRLASYGVLIGVGQFGVLYAAMDGHISPGLASLVVQTQVFFTIGLAMHLGRERLQATQALGLALAVTGLATIAWHTDGSTTALGLGMVLFAALAWALGNTIARGTPAGTSMFAFVVWSSVWAVPPLALLALLVDGPAATLAALRQATPGAWLATAWQAWGNTLFGYAAWAWLLARHPAATISPLALGVPVFGMAASAGWLGEPMPPWKLAAMALVLAGLALGMVPGLASTGRLRRTRSGSRDPS